MKSSILLFTLILVFFSCHTKTSNEDILTSDINPKPDTLLIYSQGDTLNPIPILSGDLENTLMMYINKDSFKVYFGDWYIKIFSVNNAKFGIIGDSLFRIYKLNNNSLLKLTTEQGMWEVQHLLITDINYDGYDDVIMYNDHGGINYDTKTLVFNATSETLEHKEYLDLENLDIDIKSHLLRSYHIPHSPFGVNRKALYRSTRDSLELVKEVICYIESTYPNETNKAVLITQTATGNKRICDTLYTTTDKAFSIFNKSLWDTTNDIAKRNFED